MQEVAQDQKRILVDPETGSVYKVPLSALEDPSVVPIVTISVSKLQSLLRCAKQFEYQYILKIKRPIPPVMVASRAMHYALSKYFERKIKREIQPVQNVLDTFVAEWKRGQSESDIEWNPKDVAAEEVRTAAEWEAVGITLLYKYIEGQAASVEPLLVEEPFAFELSGTHYHITGRIDLETTDHRIVDLKWSKKTKSQYEADRDLQATAYALRYFHSDRRRSRPVTVDFHCGVDKKAPDWAVVSTERDLADVAMFESLVRSAIMQLEAGIFTPNPTSFMCGKGVCQYWDECRGDTAKKFISCGGQ